MTWMRWEEYLNSVGVRDDTFLESLSKGQRIRMCGAFAMALREGRFSGPSHGTLVESTMKSALGYVAQTFRDNDQPNPTHDKDHQLGCLLTKQYRAFKNKDPPPKQQKALPIGVLRVLAELQVTELQRAIIQLSIGAYFFACRSCEYLLIPQAEKRRTDILRIRNIRFFSDGRELSHNDSCLEYADCVSITFEFQKKDERNDTVTQMASKVPSASGRQLLEES